MTSTSDEAVAALGRVLGNPPPASLHNLDPDLVTRLAAAVTAESRRQEQALGQAVDHALRLVPRPLRGIVRKMIQP